MKPKRRGWNNMESACSLGSTCESAQVTVSLFEGLSFAAHFRPVLQADYARTARMDARPNEKTYQTWTQ